MNDNILKSLQEYFNNTSQDKVLKDWEETKEWDDIEDEPEEENKKDMTAKEKLHAVEVTIRKAFPMLMEPTEGCWLNLHYNDEKDNKATEKCKIIGVDKKGKLLIRFEDGVNTLDKQDLEKYIKIGSYSILGHDILLSDVLEWLNTEKMVNILCENIAYTGHNGFVSLIQNGYLDISYYSHEYEISLTSRLGKWDLSKPHLVDQSEELWNFLYNLIKEDNE